MSARLVDHGTSHRDSGPKMEAQRSKRASLDRQTQLAHLKLASKYYGYENFSYPKTENRPAPGQYRRAGHSYPGHPTERTSATEKRTPEPVQQPQLPPSPTRRRNAPRTLERTSFGSDGSTPSLIDDRTDSEVSHDDDYQYHASTSQLWDSFWVSQNGDGTKVGQYVGPARGHSQKEVSQEPPTTRYPAFIPSPHIKRTKKTSTTNYAEEALPPRPVEYSIPVRQSQGVQETEQKTLPLQFPSTTTTEETRRTIRDVKSSYSLFPRQASATPAPPVPAVNTSRLPPAPPPAVARPRTSSLPRRPSGTPAPVITQRKSSRPQPIHIHSDPLPQIPEPCEAPVIRSPPHSSHGPARARASTTAAHSSAASVPSHLCEPDGMRTTIPLFPSTNLADLINPRSAPRPPASEETPPYPSDTPVPVRLRLFSAPRPAPLSLTLTTEKSFFDLDSDSDAEPPAPKGGISRIIRKGRKCRSSEDAPPASRPSQDLPRASTESMRRCKSRANLAILSGRKTPSVEDKESAPLCRTRSRSGRGRKSDVFGRMFGRGSTERVSQVQTLSVLAREPRL